MSNNVLVLCSKCNLNSQSPSHRNSAKHLPTSTIHGHSVNPCYLPYLSMTLISTLQYPFSMSSPKKCITRIPQTISPLSITGHPLRTGHPHIDVHVAGQSRFLQVLVASRVRWCVALVPLLSHTHINPLSLFQKSTSSHLYVGSPPS